MQTRNYNLSREQMDKVIEGNQDRMRKRITYVINDHVKLIRDEALQYNQIIVNGVNVSLTTKELRQLNQLLEPMESTSSVSSKSKGSQS